MTFSEWLEEKKGFTHKSAHDVQSRLKRVCEITGRQVADDSTLVDLSKDSVFLGLSMSVKSQLRRATKLYLEYKEIQLL